MKTKLLGCAGILAGLLLGIVGVKALTVNVWNITYKLVPTKTVYSEARDMNLQYQKVTNTPDLVRTDYDGAYLDVAAMKKNTTYGYYETQLIYRFYNPEVDKTDSESYYYLTPGNYIYQLTANSLYINGTVKVYNSDLS